MSLFRKDTDSEWYEPGLIEAAYDRAASDIYHLMVVARVAIIALPLIVQYVFTWSANTNPLSEHDNIEIDRRIAREVYTRARRRKSRILRYASMQCWQVYKARRDKTAE